MRYPIRYKAIISRTELVGPAIQAQHYLSRKQEETFFVGMNVGMQRTPRFQLAETQTHMHGAGSVINQRDPEIFLTMLLIAWRHLEGDRKSTRLNSSHV